MEESKSINGLYFELDTLIDTRLGLLYVINNNLAKSVLSDASYFDRISDDFIYVSNEVFHDIYKRRDKRLLNLPTLTNVPNLIAEYYIEASQADLTTGGAGRINMFLNVYPYKLDSHEVSTLLESFKLFIHKDVNLEVINRSPESITPEWLDANVGMAIMYGAIDWVDYHSSNGNLKRHSIPDTVLIAPALLTGDTRLNRKDVSNMFDEVAKTIAPLVGLRFMPPEVFSIKLKRKKK